MEQFIGYARSLGASETVIGWIEGRLAKHMATPSAVRIEDVEHIIDYFISGQAPARFQNMSYEEAHVAAEKWTKTLQKKGSHIKEVETDVETVLDFKDGFRIVKLVGKPAYEREGFLMRHCVASYYGNAKEIFSLRDIENMPHCTIEKDQQIKGKGNGDISPRYIDYIVRFLEHTGMAVRDSEMAHLGYEAVPFGRFTKTKLYRDRYAVKGTGIEYQEGVRFFDKKSDLTHYLGDDTALFRGDLTIVEKEKFTSKTLAEVSGYVDVQKGATFTAPKLAEVSGYVYVQKGATFTAPKLAEVSGYVDVQEGATFTAPKLAEVSGYVDVQEGATFTAPKLAEVSGYVYVQKGATFTAPKLAEVSGSVYVQEGATFTAPKLEKSGYVYVQKGATFTAPKLAEVSGYVYVQKGATFTAPKLAEVSGYVYVQKGATFTAPLLGYNGKKNKK